MPLRRIEKIDDGVRLFRSIDNGPFVEASRHAQLPNGVKVRAKSDTISYGNLGYWTEVIADDLQTRVGLPWRVSLDISQGSSRERLDRWESDSLVPISKKYREDYDRHNTQIIAEKERGTTAYGSVSFICIISSRSRSRDYEKAGYDQVFTATATANRRQFFSQDELGNVVENTPQPQEFLSVNMEDYLIDQVDRDVSIVRFHLSSAQGNEVNK